MPGQHRIPHTVVPRGIRGALVQNGRMTQPDDAPATRGDAASAFVDPEAFEGLVADAIDTLPAPFLERLGSVAIVVEEEPTPAQLAVAHAAGLLGLYTGVPRTLYASEYVPIPSKITIFRGPHLRMFRTPEALAAGVAATVRHEVAHHFGISDERLRELADDGHGRQRGR